MGMSSNVNVENAREGIAKAQKVCIIIVFVLLYLLTVVAGLYQELSCYVIDRNYSTSLGANDIIEVAEGRNVEEILERLEYFDVKAPMGSGNYVSLFDNNTVFVVRELTLKETLQILWLFFVLDIASYIVTLVLIRKNFAKHKMAVTFLMAYELLFLLFSWVTQSYCWKLLLHDRYVSPVQIAVRILILFIVFATAEKSASFHGKNKRLG